MKTILLSIALIILITVLIFKEQLLKGFLAGILLSLIIIFISLIGAIIYINLKDRKDEVV